MIDKLVDLGKKIEAKYNELGSSKSSEFADLCFDELKSIEFDISLDEFDQYVSDWIENTTLPTQLNVYNSFGQPPLTIFNNGEFVVDLYFWMHSDTSIHSHAFSGAFKVLFGRSLHEVYTVNTLKSYSEDVIQTDIKREDVKILYPDDSYKILAGDEFCHRVIHLEAPTVTLCIRTVNDLTIPQWHHFENGLSILKRELDESVYKKMLFSEYLITRNYNNGIEFLNKYIKSLDNSEVMNLFEQLSVDSMGLNEQTTELIYNSIINEYSSKEWFTKYEQFCLSLEEYIQPNIDTPEERFFTHAKNTSYSVAQLDKFFHEIKSYKPNNTCVIHKAP
jgi:hypothetical protein